MKNKKTLVNESINKIKYLINYDSSKILTEQFFMPKSIAPLSPKNIGTYKKEYLDKIKIILDFGEEHKEKLLKKIPKTLSDAEIYELVKTLYAAMQGVGINKKPIADVFEKLGSITDAITLNDLFNKTFGLKQNLHTWIKREYSISLQVLSRIYKSLDTLFKNAAQQIKTNKETQINPELNADVNPELPLEPATKVVAPTGGYEFVKGTNDDPYKYGKLGSGIAYVQEMLGFQGEEIDGKWGPNTNKKMKEMLPDYIDGFTNNDILNIVKKFKQKEIEPYLTMPKPETSQIKTPTVAPPIEKSKLA